MDTSEYIIKLSAFVQFKSVDMADVPTIRESIQDVVNAYGGGNVRLIITDMPKTPTIPDDITG